MTINKGYSLDVSDIQAISLVCHDCTASLNLPPSNLQKDSPERCPNCGKDWFAHNTPEQQALKTFLKSLSILRERSGKQVCQLRLEILQPN